MFNHIINSYFKEILGIFFFITFQILSTIVSCCWTLSAAYGTVDLSLLLGMFPALATFQSPLTIPPPLPILLNVSVPRTLSSFAGLSPHFACFPSVNFMHFHRLSTLLSDLDSPIHTLNTNFLPKSKPLFPIACLFLHIGGLWAFLTQYSKLNQYFPFPLLANWKHPIIFLHSQSW